MSIEEQYRRIRNQIRQLAHRDSLYVIWAYSQFLQFLDFKIPNDIEVAQQLLDADLPRTLIAEWTLEQLARETIRYADEESRRGRSLHQWGTQAAAWRGEWNNLAAVLDWLGIADCSCHQNNSYNPGRRAEPHKLSLFALLNLDDMACHAARTSITCSAITRTRFG